MAKSGKCPKCGALLSHTDVEPIKVKAGSQKAWKGVQYLCPYCSVILGVGIDDVALHAQTVNQILKALRN
jgi:predicted RNA-binding Zn-ribbon protein involved in translation (DUF1610 family)